MPDSKPSKRLTTSGIIGDFVRDFTNADRGMGGTFLQLTLRPERVVYAYLEGDRQRFIRPTRYMTFVLSLSAVYLLSVQYWYDSSLTDMILSQTGPGFAQALEDDLMARHAETPFSDDQLASIRQQHAAQVETVRSIYRYLLDYYTVAILLAIPVGAVVYRFAYPHSKFNFAESTIAWIYLSSQAILIGLLLSPVALLVAGGDPISFTNWTIINTLIGGGYLAYAFQRTYRHQLGTLIKGTLRIAALAFVVGVGSWAAGALSYIVFESAEGTVSYLRNHTAFFIGTALMFMTSTAWLITMWRLNMAEGRSRRSLWILAATLLLLLLTVWVYLRFFH